jgi:hypothetical protein
MVKRRRKRSVTPPEGCWNEFLKLFADQPIFVRSKRDELRRRDELIRSEHRKDVEAGVPKIRSMEILGYIFRLSVKRIQAIIYK